MAWPPSEYLVLVMTRARADTAGAVHTIDDVADYGIDWTREQELETDPYASTRVVVTVHMTGTPPPSFPKGWEEALKGSLGAETLGRWDVPIWTSDSIKVPGVAPESVHELNHFLDRAVRRATVRAARIERESRTQVEAALGTKLSAEVLSEIDERFRR
jgi:hypothetical protein